MKIPLVSRGHLFLIIVGLMLLATLTHAQATNPRALVALGGAAASGQQIHLVKIGGNINNPFVVPSGKFLVLTDIVISPQVIGTEGIYAWEVTSSSGPMTAISVTSATGDASSFQVHLTTGMVFHDGSTIRFWLLSGNSPVNVNAFGYLVSVH